MSAAAVDLKTKEEKDAELDRRIEALRKKNEALVRRYQEIEEDKKKAEQEGISVTTVRKPRLYEGEPERRRADNLTVTVDLSKPTGEKRVINDRKGGVCVGRRGPEDGDTHLSHSVPVSPKRMAPVRTGRGLPRGGSHTDHSGPEMCEQADAVEGPERVEFGRARGGRRGRGRGGASIGPTGLDRKAKEWEEKRRQNIEKMNKEMEQIAEFERGEKADGEKNPSRNFLDDPRRSGPVPEADRKEGSRRHVRNWGGVDFDNVKTGGEVEREWVSCRSGTKVSVDMTLSMTGRERAEYLRWKKEREQIDEERLARHRSATGQWRREWDAEKTDTMFKEETLMSKESLADPNRRDEGRKPPKAPTLGDFVKNVKSKEGGRERGKGRARGKGYSMHDNRWDEGTDIDAAQEQKKVETETMPTVGVASDVTAEEAEDEWEDVEDGQGEEDEGEDEVPHLTAKDKRTPRPRVHIPNPTLTPSQEPPESKPLSPFSPSGHKPVRDWGEEMEMESPRSSLGTESPHTARERECDVPAAGGDVTETHVVSSACVREDMPQEALTGVPDVTQSDDTQQRPSSD